MSASRIFLDTNILINAVLKESPRYFHARGVLRRLEEREVDNLDDFKRFAGLISVTSEV